MLSESSRGNKLLSAFIFMPNAVIVCVCGYVFFTNTFPSHVSVFWLGIVTWIGLAGICMSVYLWRKTNLRLAHSISPISP